MMREFVAVCILFPAFTASAVGQDWATKMFKTTRHDFGSVVWGAKAEFAFTFENLYAEDVHVSDVQVTCTCTTPLVEKPLVKTYETGKIIAHINTDRFIGQRGATIIVTFDRPYFAQVHLEVKAFIRNDIDFRPHTLQFGNVDAGNAGEARAIVNSTCGHGWKILEVRSADPHLTAEAVEKSWDWNQATYDIRGHLDAKASPGPIHDHLILVTNDPNAREVLLMVEGQVVPDIRMAPTSVYLGVTHPGDKVNSRLIVRGKEPFRIKKAVADEKMFTFTLPGDATKKIHVLPFTFTAGNKTGKVVQKIRVETDHNDTVVEATAYAVVAEPE